MLYERFKDALQSMHILHKWRYFGPSKLERQCRTCGRHETLVEDVFGGYWEAVDVSKNIKE
jgi:hypothetical protein